MSPPSCATVPGPAKPLAIWGGNVAEQARPNRPPLLRGPRGPNAFARLPPSLRDAVGPPTRCLCGTIRGWLRPHRSWRQQVLAMAFAAGRLMPNAASQNAALAAGTAETPSARRGGEVSAWRCQPDSCCLLYLFIFLCARGGRAKKKIPWSLFVCLSIKPIAPPTLLYRQPIVPALGR